MLSQYNQIIIGFGNKNGQLSEAILKEKVKIISLGNIGKTNHKKISILAKQHEMVQPGIIGDMIRKRRDQRTLQDLLKISVSCNYDEIINKCENIESKIANDLAIVGIMNQQTNTDKFTKETGATGTQAAKYLDKYNNCDEAIRMYKVHQQKVNKFMKSNNCDKKNAISFLESCDYNDQFLN